MNSSTSEGQHRSLLMQQEQMHGFKEVVERAVYKASNVMARVTSSLFLSPKGISEALKEDFDKLSWSKVDEAPDSGNMWHQVRYQRDKTAWIEERDVLYTKLSQAQQEADSLRASLGSQSLKIHELREAVQALENEKTLQTSDYAKNTLELKRALEFERSMNTDKQSRIEKLEGLYDRERLHSERVVRQAVSTLQIMKQDGVLKPGNDQPILQNHAGNMQLPSKAKFTQLFADTLDLHRSQLARQPAVTFGGKNQFGGNNRATTLSFTRSANRARATNANSSAFRQQAEY